MRDRRLTIAVCLMAVAFGATAAAMRTSASGRSEAGPRASDPGTACTLRPGHTHRLSLALPGQELRTALIHLPSHASMRPLPLVLALHGATDNARFFEKYTGLSTLADTAGFAVVYPNATTASGHWWTLHGAGADDVTFLTTLLDRLLAGGCFDAKRVFATGHSNGGGMAAKLGCLIAGRLAAIAPVSGGYGNLPRCTPSRPLSVLEIHGTADDEVHYPGNVLAWVRGWAKRDGCPVHSTRTILGSRLKRLAWHPCRDGTRVIHLVIAGGVHGWPQGHKVPPDRGPRAPISAAQVVWRFFAATRPR